MDEGRPSFTALETAMLRAAHLLWDDPPKIFEDTFALALSGCANEVELKKRADAFVAELAAKADRKVAVSIFDSFRISVALRSRYIEDELTQAIKQGVAQYVILGAGLDSFAYRRQDLANVLRVFEVDHPATQTWRGAAAGVESDHATQSRFRAVEFRAAVVDRESPELRLPH